MKAGKILLWALMVVLLTMFTQVGGLLLLASCLSYPCINKLVKPGLWRTLLKAFSFLIIYFLASWLLLPLIAKPFGRVPMPVFAGTNVKPLRLFTCVLNRHYVRTGLKTAVLEAAAQMQQRSPGIVVQYLDAAFPLFDFFPLLPHRSHADGKKIDLAFHYLDAQTKQPVQDAPSMIGYGIGEEPRPGESDIAAVCDRKGYWQYSFMSKIIPSGSRKDFIFDSVNTALLINNFVSSPIIDKVFLEPHLKERWKLTSSKIRFHGCAAVRHDDHLHVQIK